MFQKDGQKNVRKKREAQMRVATQELPVFFIWFQTLDQASTSSTMFARVMSRGLARTVDGRKIPFWVLSWPPGRLEVGVIVHMQNGVRYSLSSVTCSSTPH